MPLHLSYIQLRGIFILISILTSGLLKAQAVDFTTDTRQGCAPLVVRSFTNLTTGNPVKYFWDFGNGNISNQESPGTIYFTPGSYTVKLVVEYATGRRDSMVKTDYVLVNTLPSVKFSPSGNSGCAPYTVRFADESVGGSGPINKWEWDFGDGTTSSAQSPTHTFNNTGDFTITLKASDANGCGDVRSEASLIQVKQASHASFTSNAATTCNPPAVYNFVNTSIGGPFTSTSWNFGDGATSSAPNPSHTYRAGGTYPVTLTVTNDQGCVSSTTVSTVVPSFTAAFNISPDIVCQGALVRLANTSTPATVSSYWNFGDNTFSTDIHPVKRYATAGSFTIKLVNDFGNCKDSTTKTITVLPKPTANFTSVLPASQCLLPANVSFTSQSSGAANYVWDFGDKTTSTLVNPTHTYTAYGSYAVKLVATGSNGCADSITKSNAVALTPAKIIGLNGLPYSGCVPRQQNFSANTRSPESITSYLWDFGDGNTATTRFPQNNYTVEGSYTVSLKITTVNGCTDNFTLPAAVNITTKPKADFTADPLIACASDTIRFADRSTGTIDKRKWFFGDGDSSILTNSFHRYRDSGFFTVRLIVANVACYDTATKQKFINIKAPIARFKTQYDCTTPLKRVFQNKSILAQTYKWTFGDGGEATTSDPEHTYAAPGIYIVRLQVTGQGCADDITDTVKVIDEKPDFTVVQSGLCRNNTSVFTATSVNTKNIATYTWNFGDNAPPVTKTTPVANYNYLTAGSYQPALTIKDILGCTKTVQQAASIIIYGPKADFSNPNAACTNRVVNFTDKSRASPNHPITGWILNYGDGKADTATVATFSHAYASPKTYNPTLIVTDSYGCKDTAIKIAAITVTTARASFATSDSVYCNNSTVDFVNTSTGYKLTYLWKFDDGTTETIKSPSHTFSAERVYNVSLTIKDSVGCIDSAKMKNGLIIANPKASFSVDDSVISCPPAQINFQNNSKYAASVKWDFDNGNFSYVSSPPHYFSQAGTYHVKLITYGHGSCADSTVKDIVVKGPRGSLNYSPTFNCAPATVNFNANASDFNKDFTWDFGEGNTISSAGTSISHVYNAPGKYVPKLFLIDTSINCKVSIMGTDTVTVSKASSYIKAHQSLFCDSAGIRFSDSSIIQFDTISSYLWAFGDGSISNRPDPSHNYRAAGIYPVRLTIKTVGGCTDTSAIDFVKVVKSPRLKLTGPAETCVADRVSFFAAVEKDTSALQWSWDFNNGGNYPIPFPPAQTYSAAGKYAVSVTVINSSGCTTTDKASLTVHPLPDINAGTDSVICRGAAITLKASGADSYLWQAHPTLSCTSCASPVVSPVDTLVTYYVTGTNVVGGCRRTDSVQVRVVQPFKVLTVNADTLCVGESVKLLATGAPNYTWTPAMGLSNTNTPNPVARPDTTTVYTVTGYDDYNCFRDVAQVPITVYPIPVFNIIADNLSVAAGTGLQLRTTSSPDVTNWQWFPPAGLSCSNCAEPFATASNTIVYKAIATNPGGCRTEDRVTLQVFCNNGNIFIPNTFSPNNDGSNDVFYPRGKGIAGVRHLQIFNRSGVVVYQRSNFAVNDPSAGWDGTYGGKKLDSDAFVYQAEVICETGQVFSLKGDITLIR